MVIPIVLIKKKTASVLIENESQRNLIQKKLKSFEKTLFEVKEEIKIHSDE